MATQSKRVWFWVGYETNDLGSRGFKVYTKRWEWIPGSDQVIPDQPCVGCREDAHWYCVCRPLAGLPGAAAADSDSLPFVSISLKRWPQYPGDMKLPVTFVCTCTHPSHQDE